MDDSDDGATAGLFEEPEGYFKPEKKPTEVVHQTLDGRHLMLRLIGSSPLWGHLLWNAGRTVADYLEREHETLVKDKYVLELGAGAGLPSLICALNKAKYVVVTDYPDADLVENLGLNVERCSQHLEPVNIEACGYLWGADTDNLLHRPSMPGGSVGFDLLILADLLFNHSEHAKLLATIQKTLRKRKEAQALVFFTPYRPWLLQKDLAFFDLAKEDGFVVEKILETTMDKVMFEDDPGDELLRRTVFGYSLKWTPDQLQGHTREPL